MAGRHRLIGNLRIPAMSGIIKKIINVPVHWEQSELKPV
ncbi:hypothetical protein GJA_2705 [Janthinobacterium agaricidamnosum NBRC 102515 = DSM 9628]|uniref:Uncharacterized protein n=1 Tax=Janthinobacterium agaricidamnosum NBRC 102515 = DSM 9628 TaxID=1349767 RepID=W0V629_9BURK|nr:hypothetical protein GJA_2705 [Janthinobacterium agaricidamnosum NBRC 102515 = DSM 9628]